MVLRSGRPIVDAATDHARQCERLDWLRDRLGDAVFPISYEELVADCAATLRGVLEFLQVDADPDYLAACSDLVDHDLVPESTRVSWTQAAVDIVEDTIHNHEFLTAYRL